MLENPRIRGYREILGVSSGSKVEEVKKAYRKLAKLYHPDVNLSPDSQSQFLQITEAYETLVDSQKVQALNQEFLRQQLQEKQFGNLKLNFGTFFGYRLFTSDKFSSTIKKKLTGKIDQQKNSATKKTTEQSRSITDSIACDHFELLYAGKFSPADHRAIKKGLHGSYLKRLPWVVLNNQGILQFLDENYPAALKTYEELNRRIPNNILFLYRLGLCQIIQAFEKSKRNLLGRLSPQSHLLKKGIRHLELAIEVGESREVGRQSCLTIHKVLADVYGAAGMRRKQKNKWVEIQQLSPKCLEARSWLSSNSASKKHLLSKS